MTPQPVFVGFAEVRVPVPIPLDRPRVMTFNLNTEALYEQITGGRNYMDAITRVQAAYFQEIARASIQELQRRQKLDPNAKLEKGEMIMINFTQLSKTVSAKEIQNILWAALHEYNDRDEPVTDITPGKLGRYIKTTDVITLIPAIIKGHIENSPDRKELGEAGSAGRSAPPPAPETSPNKSGQENGGGPSFEFSAEDLGTPSE